MSASPEEGVELGPATIPVLLYPRNTNCSVTVFDPRRFPRLLRGVFDAQEFRVLIDKLNATLRIGRGYCYLRMGVLLPVIILAIILIVGGGTGFIPNTSTTLLFPAAIVIGLVIGILAVVLLFVSFAAARYHVDHRITRLLEEQNIKFADRNIHIRMIGTTLCSIEIPRKRRHHHHKKEPGKESEYTSGYYSSSSVRGIDSQLSIASFSFSKDNSAPTSSQSASEKDKKKGGKKGGKAGAKYTGNKQTCSYCHARIPNALVFCPWCDQPTVATHAVPIPVNSEEARKADSDGSSA